MAGSQDAGSLGLPRIGVLQNLGIQRQEAHEMSFYDTKLPDSVENAFQALALDERRTSFAPALWEKREGNKTVRKSNQIHPRPPPPNPLTP
jgi:hypothetical protein